MAMSTRYELKFIGCGCTRTFFSGRLGLANRDHVLIFLYDFSLVQAYRSSQLDDSTGRHYPSGTRIKPK